ncbi:MAG: hypothetical protein KGL43_06880 [Burkholderiales bacterium]|nr:hypothetical protein [Burkholderiales bacterium]
MKLMFVENRYATWMFEAVAHHLAAAGHEIHWLVQNPVFAPRWGRIHLLPFPPRGMGSTEASADDYGWLRRTDRGVLHFGGNDRHYPHYDRHIASILQAVGPDVVFGEATEFHELLTIGRSRQLGITYLSPNATRYPPDRLTFNLYDTLDSIGGEGTLLNDDEVRALLDAIRGRKVIPGYMQAGRNAKGSGLTRRLSDKFRVTRGWLAGERFVTPSPMRKLELQAEQKRQQATWDGRSARQAPAVGDALKGAKPWVLYPMQLQPEGNIDVWGRPWNDQAEIIRRSARALAGTDATLIVKPNPKSKYEMSARLNEVMDAEPNVLGLGHATPMAEVFPAATLVLTVTGTVLIESVLAGKPVASLGNHSLSRYPGVTALDSPETLPEVLRAAHGGKALRATEMQACTLLRQLHATSYPAILWDPLMQPQLASQDNVGAMARAFTDVLRRVGHQSAQPHHDMVTP